MHLWDKNAKECQQIAYRLSIWGKTNSESASYFLRHLLAGGDERSQTSFNYFQLLAPQRTTQLL
jgi:hypothetical protein